MTLDEAIEHYDDEQLRYWLKDYKRLLDIKTRCRNCVYNVFDYQKTGKMLDNGGLAVLNTGELKHLCSWLSQPIDTVTECPLISHNHVLRN